MVIPLEIYEALLTLQGCAGENDYVFPSQKSPQMSRYQVFRIVKKAAKKAGLSHSISTHWLRHANATIAIHNGASLDLVRGIIQTLFSNGPNLYAGTLGGGVFRSPNQGDSWTSANNGMLPTSSVTSFDVSGTNLFAGTVVGGVFRSGDNGDSWTAVNNGLPQSPFINALVVSGTNIFAGTDDGVFRSINQGESWTAVNTGLPPFPSVTTFAISGTNIFACLAGLAYRSSNQGDNWTQVSTGLPGRDINVIIASGTSLFIGTEGSGGVYRSTNQGDNWIEVSAGLTDTFVQTLTVAGTTLSLPKTRSGFRRIVNNVRLTVNTQPCC